MFTKLKKSYKDKKTKIKIKIDKSLRLELLAITIFSLFITSICYWIISDYLRSTVSKHYYTNFEADRRSHDNDVKNIINSLTTKDNTTEGKDYIQTNINNRNGKIYLTDLDGNVKYKSDNNFIEKINISDVIDKISNSSGNSKDYYNFYPIRIKGVNYYFIYEDTLTGAEETYYSSSHIPIAFLISFAIFTAIFLMKTRGKIQYIEYISKSIKEISKGDLNYMVDIKGTDELAALAEDINYMEEQIKDKIEKERKAEKTKNDLITNVSHDLRTPLTSIMGYVGLVKDKKYENEEQMKEYLNIAFTKAEKLKVLIDDLFTFTKINNDGIKLTKSKIAVNEMIRQLSVELAPLSEEKNITIIDNMEKEKVFLEVDGDKLSRVFENLFTNAIKYSPINESIQLTSKNSTESFTFIISNKCDNLSQVELNKIFERFYRSDESRNSKTGGSGLGLAISKSIIDLHHGKIWADLTDDRINFYVKLYK